MIMADDIRDGMAVIYYDTVLDHGWGLYIGTSLCNTAQFVQIPDLVSIYACLSHI